MPTIIRESRIDDDDREFLGLPILRCSGCRRRCEDNLCIRCRTDLAAARPSKRRNGRPADDAPPPLEGRDLMED